MGLRRLCFLLSVTCALVVAGCGDNIHPGAPGDGKGSDVMGSGSAAGSDAGSDGSGSDGSGSNCNSPDITCGSACIDPNTDNTHCGGCGVDCTLNSKVCSTGHCCDSTQDWDTSLCCDAGKVFTAPTTGTTNVCCV